MLPRCFVASRRVAGGDGEVILGLEREDVGQDPRVDELAWLSGDRNDLTAADDPLDVAGVFGRQARTELGGGGTADRESRESAGGTEHLVNVDPRVVVAVERGLPVG